LHYKVAVEALHWQTLFPSDRTEEVAITIHLAENVRIEGFDSPLTHFTKRRSANFVVGVVLLRISIEGGYGGK
jgi:hypothetical protein